MNVSQLLNKYEKYYNGSNQRCVGKFCAQTYSADRQVADSATTATAILSGVKINDGTIGVDGRAVRESCSSLANPDVKVSTILDWFIEDGESFID